VSTDPAPESAFASSFSGRPPGQLPSALACCALLGRQGTTVDQVPLVGSLTRRSLGTAMVMAKPAPCVRALGDAVDQAMRAPSPRHALSARPRAWLACRVTAVLVTHTIGWARWARARLGRSARAAWSWRCRQRQRPGDARGVARVRVSLRPSGLTWGRLVIDASDHQRSKSATTRAQLDQLHEKARGGDVWGPRLGCLLGGTPALPRPVGFPFAPPAPALRAWDKPAKARQQHEGPPPPRPPPPPPHPSYPTTPERARRLLAPCTAAPPTCPGHWSTADAL
jgi:hypothetical protein